MPSLMGYRFAMHEALVYGRPGAYLGISDGANEYAAFRFHDRTPFGVEQVSGPARLPIPFRDFERNYLGHISIRGWIDGTTMPDEADVSRAFIDYAGHGGMGVLLAVANLTRDAVHLVGETVKVGDGLEPEVLSRYEVLRFEVLGPAIACWFGHADGVGMDAPLDGLRVSAPYASLNAMRL